MQILVRERRRRSSIVLTALTVAATLSATSLTLSTVPSGASVPAYHLLAHTSPSLRATFVKLFLAAEKKTHTLSPSAKVYLVQHFDLVGSNGKTHAGPALNNPLVVDGPGHHAWAYALFYPSPHSSLHDSVALQDGNGVALFEASPHWHVLQIGVGYPVCVRSVLNKVVPTPVSTLWLAKKCL